MEILYSILSDLFFCFAILIVAKKQIHMFQLNSYATGMHLRWILKHKVSVGSIWLPFIIICLGKLLSLNSFLLNIIASLLFIATACTSIEYNIKKPLSFTPRIVRLIITMVVLTAGFIMIGHFANLYLLSKTWIFATVPFLMLVANLINNPIEAAIKQHYIAEAKGILEDANSMKVIGITGSFGKTSMKYFLTAFLRAKYDVLSTPGNYNTTMGVVRTVREQYSPTNQIFVCEMGARHIGDIKEICDLVCPDAGIITAIGPQHLETFKSLDKIKSTKYELADSLKDESPLFLNGDDENIMSVPHKKSSIIYGLNNHCDYYADNIYVTEAGTSFTIHTPKGNKIDLSTRLLGRHNVLNIVGAIAVAHTFGISLERLVPIVKNLEGVPHRLQLLKNGNGAIIDDAYNSNPEGAKAALEVLSMFDGIKVLVTPGMVELGSQQDCCNFAFGVNAAAVCDFVVLVGKHQTEAIKEGLLSVEYPISNILTTENFAEAMIAANSYRKDKKKYILLENDLPDNY